MFCLKGRRSIELPEIGLLERFVVIYLFCVPISLCRRFAKTNQFSRSVFSISVSDVDSNFSLRLEDSEAGENDEWWVVLQVIHSVYVLFPPDLENFKLKGVGTFTPIPFFHTQLCWPFLIYLVKHFA